MITKLKINNFKSIESFDNSIKPLTILVGKNSTGKSSIIQSILLLASRSIPKNQYPMEELIFPFAVYKENVTTDCSLPPLSDYLHRLVHPLLSIL